VSAAEDSADGAKTAGQNRRCRWWQEWLRPPSLFTLISLWALAVGWYVNVAAHCQDVDAKPPRYHHTIEELRQQFVPLDVHAELQREQERRFNELGEKLDRLNAKVDRLLERR
jgi:hypothetical protein